MAKKLHSHIKEQPKKWVRRRFRGFLSCASLNEMEAAIKDAKEAEAKGEWRKLELTFDYTGCYYESDVPGICIEGEYLDNG